MASMAVLSLVIDLVGRVLAPERCVACEAPVGFRTVFCRPCCGTLVPSDDDSTQDAASFVYGGAVAEAITHFKYGQHPELARPLATLLLRAVSRLSADPPDVVVPVPLHPSRLADRGYNQAALLASPVARALSARFEPQALARIRPTERQATLDRSARLANVTRAFGVRRGKGIERRRVLLIDDVRTTGATLQACRETLLEGGAREVLTAVIARAAE
jgi:ComF family protein